LLTKPDPNQIQAAMMQKPILEEQEKKAQERQDDINGLVRFLRAQGSPVATSDYASQIYDLSTSNGADYRIVVAIMGVETGFCQKPFIINGNSSYNCFGYINHVKYASFKSAFADLIPKISRQYVAKYGWNFSSLAQAYGEMDPSDPGKLSHIANSF